MTKMFSFFSPEIHFSHFWLISFWGKITLIWQKKKWLIYILHSQMYVKCTDSSSCPTVGAILKMNRNFLSFFIYISIFMSFIIISFIFIIINSWSYRILILLRPFICALGLKLRFQRFFHIKRNWGSKLRTFL